MSEEAAVIQGGWSTIATASRYDRLTLPVAKSIAPKMVNFHLVSSEPEPESTSTSPEALRSAGDSGIVAARAAARSATSARPARVTRAHQPITLPAGWSRIWHPTSGRQGGYATFEGPNGAKARSVRDAQRVAATAVAPRRAASPSIPPRAVSPAGSASSVYLEDLVTYENRPSTRPPPRHRSRS